MKIKFISILALCWVNLFTLCGCVLEEENIGYQSEREWIEGVPAHTDGGYLFAFITNGEYYRLHYALSRDGYNWETLNDGKIVFDEYRGHPDICLGPDGVYRMIGIRPLCIWESTDLINWTSKDLPEEVFSRSNEFGYYTVDDIGAPKMFYDVNSDQYIITWHACKTPNNNDWGSMKTLYIQTSDLVNYTSPEVLFHFKGYDEGICTIDNIIRYMNGVYYAIVKDERNKILYPETGQTIRIAKGISVTGPYENLSFPITPIEISFEAPIVIELPEDSGVALYAESFSGPEYGYHMFVSKSLDGKFGECVFNCPRVNDGSSFPYARHGCIIRISEEIYGRLIKEYHL